MIAFRHAAVAPNGALDPPVLEGPLPNPPPSQVGGTLIANDFPPPVIV